MLNKTLSLFAVALLFAAPAFAQDVKNPAPPAPPAAIAAPAPAVAPAGARVPPDTSNVPFIQNLRKAGTTIYYLGETLGMHGWFAVKDRQVQIFYTTPDSRGILVGALISADGVNISQQQITLFATEHPDVMDLIKSDSAVPMATSSAPQATASPPPSEQMYSDLAGAASVSFGKAGAPAVLMVMDVKCSHCHKTWKLLEKAVDDGKLRVIMIPVAALGGQSATEGAVWLGSANPQDAWKKQLAGDEKILSGTPDPKQVAAIAKNMSAIARWKIDSTPTLIYRGKNGKVRIVTGEPKGSDVILGDIGG